MATDICSRLLTRNWMQAVWRQLLTSMNGPKVGISCLSKIQPNAGTPENPTLRRNFCGFPRKISRDNAIGAGNQQERLMACRA